MSFDKLKKIIRYARQVQEKDDNDILVGVTGPKGSGKTSYSIQFARGYVGEYFNEHYFNVNKYVAYNNRQILEKMHTLPVYAPLIADEAIRIAWSREWNKSDNKDLIKFSAQVRPKKHIFFMNIPKLAWIDSTYREGMLDMWTWVHSVIEDGKKKSYAIVFMPDENQAEPDSWHLKQLRQTTGTIERIGRFTSIDKIYKVVSKHPCFMDLFPFPPVPKDIYERYMELRTQNVMGQEAEYVDQKDMAKIILYNLKNNWDGFDKAVRESRFMRPNYRLLAEKLSYDPSRKKTLIRHTTARNWVQEIADKVPSHDHDKIEQEDQAEDGGGDGGLDPGQDKGPQGVPGSLEG